MINGDRDGKTLIPERLFEILRSCEREPGYFPATEVFNEGWMLRLVLDTLQALNIPGHPLTFLKGSKWYSEALLSSPFRPRTKQDSLGEGFTNADGVIGHFDFRASTKSGLSLAPDAKQFVVLEAKMFSNLSRGTKNAPEYNQAARNVACMAGAIARSGIDLAALESVGFFVIAPEIGNRAHPASNIESCLKPDAIRAAVDQRITSYEVLKRPEVKELRTWEKDYLHPLVQRLATEQMLSVLSWETIIKAIQVGNPVFGEELTRFYKRCLTYSPALAS